MSRKHTASREAKPPVGSESVALPKVEPENTSFETLDSTVSLPRANADSEPTGGLASKMLYAAAIALLIYMPFHVFLSQSLSTVTGGLDAWKAGKDVITFGLALMAVLLVSLKRRKDSVFQQLVWLAVLYAGLHLLLFAVHPGLYRRSALAGIVFNNRVVAYAVIGAGVGLLVGGDRRLRRVQQLIVGVSACTALLGVVQYFLPPDMLTHFGYTIARGVRPNFFIDNNPAYPRIFSTMRDPNSFGAYLILPMMLLLQWFLADKDRRRRTIYISLLALEAAALFLTYSRGAWLATLLSIALVVVWQYHEVSVRVVRRWWPALVIAIVLFGGLAYAERHTSFVKSYIIHSTGKPQAQYDSDGFHWYFVKRGLAGIWHSPLGHGPGTAGLASIQNPHGSFLTENYYVQIGYEVGAVGLLVFLLINGVLYRALRRRHDALGLVLLATFWGYVVTNMLFHMWSNEPVALEWWLLAGFAGTADRETNNVRQSGS